MQPQKFARRSSNVSGESYASNTGRQTQRKPRSRAEIQRAKKAAAMKLAKTKASQQKNLERDAAKMEKSYEKDAKKTMADAVKSNRVQMKMDKVDQKISQNVNNLRPGKPQRNKRVFDREKRLEAKNEKLRDKRDSY